MLERGDPLSQKWQLIPDDTDVMITHRPPKGIGNEANLGFKCQKVGCVNLLACIHQLSLKGHILGHIHEDYGEYQQGQTKLINASICTARYVPSNAPIVVDI